MEEKVNPKTISEIKKIASELLALMGVDTEIEVSKEDEYYHITLAESDTSGLLIGKQGDTLFSLQMILSFILKNKLGEEVKTVLDVGGYREKQKGYLESIAQKSYERLMETGEPQYLYNLNPSQRRVVHTYLSNKEGITTESEGEGEERKLVISQKKWVCEKKYFSPSFLF